MDEISYISNGIPTILPDYEILFIHPEQLIPSLKFHRWLCGNPSSKKGEGLYHRYIRRKEDHHSCLELILYYRIQSFPYHPNDFAPIYFYFNPEGELIKITYDSFHHNARTIDFTDVVDITVVGPWHAIEPGSPRRLTTKMIASFYELTDEIVRDWWFIDGKAQLKLRSKLVDPWNAGLFQKSDNALPTFRDIGHCPVCKFTLQLDTMRIQENEFTKDYKCPKGHKFRISYFSDTMEIRTRLL